MRFFLAALTLALAAANFDGKVVLEIREKRAAYRTTTKHAVQSILAELDMARHPPPKPQKDLEALVGKAKDLAAKLRYNLDYGQTADALESAVGPVARMVENKLLHSPDTPKELSQRLETVTKQNEEINRMNDDLQEELSEIHGNKGKRELMKKRVTALLTDNKQLRGEIEKERAKLQKVYSKAPKDLRPDLGESPQTKEKKAESAPDPKLERKVDDAEVQHSLLLLRNDELRKTYRELTGSATLHSLTGQYAGLRRDNKKLIKVKDQIATEMKTAIVENKRDTADKNAMGIPDDRTKSSDAVMLN